MSDIDDFQLIAKYLKGDEKSLELLVKKYLNQVYFFIFNIVKEEKEAEDISQEVFVKAWKNLKKFDKDKNFKTWLFAIAKNTSIDHLRKKTAVPFSSFEGRADYLLEKIKDENLLPDEVADISYSQDSIMSARLMLSNNQQEILAMRYDRNLNFREIAKLLNESINTVKSRHRRAVISLKSLLK